MAEQEGWFHCGRCGHLFRETAGVRCPSCGGRPVVEENELAFLEANRRLRKGEGSPSGETSRSSRKSRPRKSRSGLTAFVIGWVAFLGLLVGLVTLARRGGVEREEMPGDFAGVLGNHQALTEAYVACTTRVREFLMDATPEGRARLVHDPDETLGRMVRSGTVELLVDEEDEGEWKRFVPLSIPGERVYESIYELQDGRRAEFVFLKDQDGEWDIDWANLVRYSDYRWSLFLAGETPPEGEFRVLARRRAGRFGKVGNVTSMVLYAPNPWHPGRLSTRSPEVEIEAGSRAAVMLGQAFEDREKGRGPFGSTLQQNDPAAMIRVRAILRRHAAEGDGEPRIELLELLACHWISVDDPGVEIESGSDSE